MESSGNTTTPAKIKEIKDKIKKARETQLARFKGVNIFNNSEISYKNIDKFCVLDDPAEKLLKQAVNARSLSLRAYHKIKKLALTIADLDASDIIKEQHVAEAVSLRMNERALSELA